MDKQTYQELLKDPRWIKRRNEILTRDKNTCQSCGAQDKYLHVHHLNYWDGFLPWEYPDDMLVTLCKDCHKKIHANTSLPDVSVGDLLGYYHSDWYMNYIVYDVDGINKRVWLLGCDDGGAVDSLFVDEWSVDFALSKCFRIDDSHNLNYLFPYWFDYILNNLDKTPRVFRYNLEQIIVNNSVLNELYINRHTYNELLEEERNHSMTELWNKND